jgi:hypothetical protein
MMSTEQMNRMADEAERRARKLHTAPLPIGNSFAGNKEKLGEHLRKLPSIGRYLPPGLKRVPRHELLGCQNVSRDRLSRLWCDDDYLFVDSSGMGGRDEGALTFAEFVDVVEANSHLRFAIVEAGQFQVVVGAFEPVAERAAA